MDDAQDRSLAFVREASLMLPGSVKDVADYLLAEGTGIASLTMAQVAARTYTSKPTLVRFAKLAGYAGWTDFRRDFLVAARRLEDERVRKARVDVNHPFDTDTPASEIVSRLARIRRLAADEVERTLDADTLEAAAVCITEASHVTFFGTAQNREHGRVFASNLAVMGILCHTPVADEAAPIAQCMGRGDCLVAVSYAGSLEHLPLCLVPSIHERGTTVVAITSSERNQLADVADLVMAFPPWEHCHDKIGPFYSGGCTTLILELLYATCYRMRYEHSRKRRKDVLESLRGHIPDSFSDLDATS